MFFYLCISYILTNYILSLIQFLVICAQHCEQDMAPGDARPKRRGGNLNDKLLNLKSAWSLCFNESRFVYLFKCKRKIFRRWNYYPRLLRIHHFAGKAGGINGSGANHLKTTSSAIHVYNGKRQQRHRIFCTTSLITIELLVRPKRYRKTDLTRLFVPSSNKPPTQKRFRILILNL